MQKSDYVSQMTQPKIQSRCSTLKPMLYIFEKIKNHEASNLEIKTQLEFLLHHQDYQIEFSRYGERVKKDEFIDFLMNFSTIDPNNISNEDLRVRYDAFKYLFEHLEFYSANIQKIEEYFTQEILEKQLEIALLGLPDSMILGNITFLFTIGIGMSFGWIFVDNEHRNYIHFDFIHLLKDFSLAQLQSHIAHEIHHIGVNQIHDSLDMDKISLEELFYIYFSGEGLAVKYCNNSEGRLSKHLYSDSPANIGLDAFSWNYLQEDFSQTYETFRRHIGQIRSGEIQTQEKLVSIIQEYWMNEYTDTQEKNEKPALKQSRIYSLGSDIWGVIHDVFGKSVVYELVQNPSCFLSLFNQALRIIGKKNLCVAEI